MPCLMLRKLQQLMWQVVAVVLAIAQVHQRDDPLTMMAGIRTALSIRHQHNDIIIFFIISSYSYIISLDTLTTQHINVTHRYNYCAFPSHPLFFQQYAYYGFIFITHSLTHPPTQHAIGVSQIHPSIDIYI